MKELKLNTLPIPTWKWLKGNEVTLPWGEETTVQPTMQGNRWDYQGGDAPYSYGTCVLDTPTGKSQSLLQVHTGSSPLRVETSMTVSDGGTMKLVQVFLGDSTVVSQVKGHCHGTGTLEVVQFFLGRGDVYSDVQGVLEGDYSQFRLNGAYITKEQILDMNILVQHQGKESQSDILLEGLLAQGGRKKFRGTIDLQKGASGATGDEHENVLLVGDDVENLTIPVLLCGQEDVKGSHGAAIGELDEEVLFYLNSRGLDKETAESLIARGKIQRILATIKDDTMEKTVRAMLEEVYHHDDSEN